MTDDEKQALDAHMKLQATIILVRNLYTFIDRLDGRSGAVGAGLRRFLDEVLPGLEMPPEVPAGIVAQIRDSLAEPIRATLADLEAGNDAPPTPPRFTVVPGGRRD